VAEAGQLIDKPACGFTAQANTAWRTRNNAFIAMMTPMLSNQTACLGWTSHTKQRKLIRRLQGVTPYGEASANYTSEKHSNTMDKRKALV